MLTRRALLKLSTAAVLGATFSARGAGPGEAARAPRPSPPYRVWFGPRLFHRDIDLYSHMTVDASGWLDPRLAHALGRTTLGWVYGPNHPWGKGPDYWRDSCSVESRSFPRMSNRPSFISAGIAIDEWVPEKVPGNEKWLAEGLRAGRKDNPDIFIAMWSTDPYGNLFQLVKEGTIDLVLVEGYTHSAAEDGPGLTTSWEGALRRTQKFIDAGLEDKTVFCFGHITARRNGKGQYLAAADLREKAQYLKKTFPLMPGVAFYQHGSEDSAEQRALIKACDQLGAELWPDPK